MLQSIQRLLGACIILLLVGCGEKGSAPCVEEIDLACAPLYTPTYDEVFTRTLLPSCGQGGTSCHSPAGAQGGLVVAEIEATYQTLLGQGGRGALVSPGDPGCSELLWRMTTENRTRQMPPGRRLSPEERCSIQRWISNGASR